MSTFILKVKPIEHEGVAFHMPCRKTDGAAGYDLFAAIAKPETIIAHGFANLPTGVSIQLPGKEYAAFIYARSGLAIRHGITLTNGVGVIDSDYTGELTVGLYNLSDNAYTFMPDERIAQMVIMPVCTPVLQQVEVLEETERSAGGFGSTGRF